MNLSLLQESDEIQDSDGDDADGAESQDEDDVEGSDNADDDEVEEMQLDGVASTLWPTLGIYLQFYYRGFLDLTSL